MAFAPRTIPQDAVGEGPALRDFSSLLRGDLSRPTLEWGGPDRTAGREHPERPGFLCELYRANLLARRTRRILSPPDIAHRVRRRLRLRPDPGRFPVGGIRVADAPVLRGRLVLVPRNISSRHRPGAGWPPISRRPVYVRPHDRLVDRKSKRLNSSH